MSETEVKRGDEWNWRSDASAENKRRVLEDRCFGWVPKDLLYSLGDSDPGKEAVLSVIGQLYDASRHAAYRFDAFKDADVFVLRVYSADSWLPSLTIGEKKMSAFFCA